MEMTLEQKKAMAMASARLRLKQKVPQAAEQSGLDAFKARNPDIGQVMQRGNTLEGLGMDLSSLAQRADDSVRTLANGMTLGFADKTVPGSDTATERAKSEQAAERLGGPASTALEIGGSMVPMVAAGGAGLTATRLPGWLGKIGMALDGAGFGAVSALGHDESVATGAGIGAAGGALGKALGVGAEKAVNAWKGRGPVPSLADLEAAKNAAYQAVDSAGEAFTPQQVQTLAQGIGDDLGASGIDEVLNPMPYRFQQVIESKAGGPMTLRELDKIDAKVGRKLLTSADGEDRYLGGMIRDNISEFMDANGGGTLVSAARDANRKYRNLERVLMQTEKAERRAASTGSGGNEDNAIRQNARAILDNPRTAKFYNTEEQAALDKVATGTTGQNITRRIGKLSPENGGLMAAMQIIGASVNPMIAAPAATGFVAKRFADRATRSNLDELITLLSTGKPKAKATAADKKNIEALMRALASSAPASARQY